MQETLEPQPQPVLGPRVWVGGHRGCRYDEGLLGFA